MGEHFEQSVRFHENSALGARTMESLTHRVFIDTPRDHLHSAGKRIAIDAPSFMLGRQEDRRGIAGNLFEIDPQNLRADPTAVVADQSPQAPSAFEGGRFGKIVRIGSELEIDARRSAVLFERRKQLAGDDEHRLAYDLSNARSHARTGSGKSGGPGKRVQAPADSAANALGHSKPKAKAKNKDKDDTDTVKAPISRVFATFSSILRPLAKMIRRSDSGWALAGPQFLSAMSGSGSSA